MSVPAHPRAIERLEGESNRGWLKPPTPEEGFIGFKSGAAGMKKILNHKAHRERKARR